ncbi:MAG: UDP-2,3-diacylglucosamine diphosphatase [Bacteroidetes bacterium]|nr:UDP-2,3-diacylglucosamine diphosphatase [Bacteroidota bacterium]
MQKKVYFASDFHFGIPDRAASLVREQLFVDWLEMARKDASEIYLMGDLFDFWFEYKTVIPRGYVRLLGKLAEITDSGIGMHLFRGNHDMWAFDYLNKELNIEIHRDPEIHEFNGKVFYLAHGDGLGPGDHGYKFIKMVFANRINQWLFRWIHPDLGIRIALFWSRQSRFANMIKGDTAERDRHFIDSRLSVHSHEMLASNPSIDYFVYGHWHYPSDIPLTEKCRQITLGDWLNKFTYAVFDGEEMKLEKFSS